MIGDVLLINQKHKRVGRQLAVRLRERSFQKLIIAISGESGSGKSEVAEMVRDVLKSENYKVKILHLDNYYKTSPAERTEYRRKNGMSVVGLHEISWDILEENLEAFRKGEPTTIPFIDLYTNQEDKLITDFSEIDIVIVEGLYAVGCSADINVYIDLTYHDTKKAQLKRKKEKVDKFRFKVLEKEHTEVLKLKPRTHYFITPDFNVVANTNTKGIREEEKKQNQMLICSTNLPIKITKHAGKVEFQNYVDGVTDAIDAMFFGEKSFWFGKCDKSFKTLDASDKRFVKNKLEKKYRYYPLVFENLNEKDNALFCYETLWPIFHYFPEKAVYQLRRWEGYKKYNEAYYKQIASKIYPGCRILIHDFQLMLLPGLIRKNHPDVEIAFFLHTPFPSFEIFRLLPWRQELLEGVLGADLIGFHIYQYVRHFLSCVYRIVGYENRLGNIKAGNRVVHTDAFPLGINYDYYQTLLKKDETGKEISKAVSRFDSCKVVFSIDRLDYTRGILLKLKNIDFFFKTHSAFKKKIIFRMNIIPPYKDASQKPGLKKEIQQNVDYINQKYGCKTWKPIDFYYGLVSKEKLTALYNVTNVFLVSSLREGLNTCIKEYLASRTNKQSALVLSEFVGGVREFPEALVFNPNDTHSFSRALNTALKQSPAVLEKNYLACNQRIERNTSTRWSVEFIEALKKIKHQQNNLKAKILSAKDKNKMVTHYHTSGKRLLAFDYNGTLVPLTKTEFSPPPDENTLKIIDILAKNPKNKVVIISDNRKENMESWFKNINVDLVASADSEYRYGNEGWQSLENYSTEWQKDAMPIIEKYRDRAPGSFINEKKHSIELHLEKTNRELKEVRSRELMEELSDILAMQNLQINENSNVVEVKNAGIYKGRIITKYLEDRSYDFIMAAGDDWTNETLFENLPSETWSVRVGIESTQARFNVREQTDFFDILRTLASK